MADAHSTKAPSGVEPRLSRLARHPVVLIAAVARNGVIGRDGRMPWTLPGDLAHFRGATMGRPVVMGRRTFASIGRPLPGRPTVVLSGDPTFAPACVVVAATFGDAFLAADRQADALGADAVMVAGGATVYAATIAQADRLLVTVVEAEPAGDTLFPAIDPRVWTKVEDHSAPGSPGDSARCRFTRWERRAPLPAAGSWLEGAEDMDRARL